MTEKLKETRRRLQTPRMSDGRLPFHPILMMHAARVAGFTYEEFMRDHSKLVESYMRCVGLYDMDAVSVISDPYRETSAFGARITFDGDYGPKASRVISSAEDVDSLECPDVLASPRTLDRIEGCRLFRETLGPQFPIIGWIEGPLAEAADLMGVSEMMMALVMEPEMLKRLTAKTLQTAKDFARAQVEAGSDIIGVGDAVCSQISPEMYAEFCHEGHKELFGYIHSLGAMVKLHICGDTTHLLPQLAKEDVDILDVDWMVDMALAHRTMGEDVMLSGHLDPVAVILEGNAKRITQAFEEERTMLPPENWIVSAGCEIPRDTPRKNMLLYRKLSMK